MSADIAMTPASPADISNNEIVKNAPLTEAVSEPLEQLDTEASTAIRSKARLYAILIALYGVEFFAALNTTIVATAIPTISSGLHSGSGYTWIGGAYLLANAASAPIWAKLSDIWGRKPILLSAVALFFLSSLVCALSTSMTMLIVARSFQGVAGGGIFQLVVIVISDLFSMRSRTIYFAIMEVIWTLAGGLGPILGGVFSQGPGWHWIWWINLPLSGAAFLLLLIYLDVHNPRTKVSDGLKALDWAGTLSILGVTLMLLLGLEFGGQTFPWDSPRVICLIVFGSLMSLIFIFSEKKLAKYPLMPMSIFGNRSNMGCLALNFVHSFTFLAAEYYLPLYLQAAKEASPLRSGVLLLPIVVSASVSGISTGYIMHKTGRYLELCWAGIFMLTLGTGLYIILDADSSVGVIVAVQIVGGIGAGFLFQPPLVALQANTPQNDIATASATFGFVRELSAAVSVVLGGVVFQNSMEGHASSLRLVGASSAIVERFSGATAAASTLMVKDVADTAVRRAIEMSYASSLRNMWIMYTIMGALGLAAVAMISKKQLSRDHVETKTGLHDRSNGDT